MTYRTVSSSLPRSWLARTLAALGATACLSAAATDLTWKNIQFGGFASQGYLVNTGHNDYLGETSDGTFDFREYAANASWSTGKLRLGAQAFGQKLGPYGGDAIKLDWAVVDYQAAQWAGVRVGRVKMPLGLYNEALDLDSVRPYVLLPQSVYDARLRDFNAAFNGGMLYGNVSLKKFGTIDYRAFYGDIPISLSSGAADFYNTGLNATTLKMKMDHVIGGTLFWNTPVAGLRTGYSYSEFDHLAITRNAFFGPTATTYVKQADAYKRQLASVEYTHGDWIFATEFGREDATFVLTPFAAVTIRPAKIKYGYVAASRRVNKWLELGTYFSYSQEKQATNALLRQADYALSAKFDLNEHLIFKVEGHRLNGAGKIFDTPSHPQPLANRDNDWTMLAVKTTYTF
ncbi:MAG: hypothetical protein NTV51_29130 [Verrucomicrobia bacterium]|nr:hypothetical protein [Verrucomicrobiota bacterium]